MGDAVTPPRLITTQEWQVRVLVSGADGRTCAHAVLGPDEVSATGAAVAEAGEDPALAERVAAARALIALGRRMLDTATWDRHDAARAARAARAHRSAALPRPA
jgi:hypothetical protein